MVTFVAGFLIGGFAVLVVVSAVMAMRADGHGSGDGVT
jgi:hypothetical protein